MKNNGKDSSCSTCTFLSSAHCDSCLEGASFDQGMCACMCVYAYKLAKVCLAAHKTENKLKSRDFKQLRI